MAQKLYECMFLLDSGKFAVDPAGTESSVMDVLSRVQAEVVAKAPWQDGKLAYPVKGQKKGLHFLVLFKMDGAQGVEFTRLCKLNPLILRHLLIQHPPVIFNAMTDVLVQHQAGPPPEPATAAPPAAPAAT